MQYFISVNVITARKRSLGQGNIFTNVCHSFCPRGRGGSASRGVGLGRPTPNPHRTLQDTVNERAVRILLECILVIVVLGPVLHGEYVEQYCHNFQKFITPITICKIKPFQKLTENFIPMGEIGKNILSKKKFLPGTFSAQDMVAGANPVLYCTRSRVC